MTDAASPYLQGVQRAFETRGGKRRHFCNFASPNVNSREGESGDARPSPPRVFRPRDSRGGEVRKPGHMMFSGVSGTPGCG